MYLNPEASQKLLMKAFSDLRSLPQISPKMLIYDGFFPQFVLLS